MQLGILILSFVVNRACTHFSLAETLRARIPSINISRYELMKSQFTHNLHVYDQRAHLLRIDRVRYNVFLCKQNHRSTIRQLSQRIQYLQAHDKSYVK